MLSSTSVVHKIHNYVLHSRRLFFSVSNEDNIYAAKMDGSNVEVIIQNASRPTSMNIWKKKKEQWFHLHF